MGSTMVEALHVANFDTVRDRCILIGTTILVWSFLFGRWFLGLVMQRSGVGSVAGLTGFLSTTIFVYMDPL